MMNIDRPLDEIVKESRAQKRKAARERRQKEREAREAKKTTPDAKPETEAPKMDVDTTTPKEQKARGGIRKKRRSRGGGGGISADKGGAKADVEVERKKVDTSRKPNKGAKVSVFNLDLGVTQSDIAELFETVGALKSARLIVLQDGRSSGSAEVVFENMADALEAIRRYNNVPLDNRPLKITLSTESAPIRLSRGRRGNRRIVVDGERRANSPRGGAAAAGAFRDERARDVVEPKDAERFDNDNDRERFNDGDRFPDNDRGYSRRNGRRSRRSYDRRPSSPMDNDAYMD